MTGEVIKEFLVGLGFEVDDSSLAQFSKAIANATLKVTALFASIQATAAGIFFSVSKISEGFEEIGYQYRIITPAINKALVLRHEMMRAYSAAGVNLQRAVVDAVKFNLALTKVQYTLKALVSGVAARFFPLLTKQLDQFRRQIYANMPKIQSALERFVKFIFKAFEATVELGSRLWSILTRVYDFFIKLDQATNGWSTIILGAVAAWKLLNLEFLATPLGAILTGLVAILALFDDFKVWQEGGQSLFNWSSFVPIINSVSASLSSLKDVLNDIFDSVGDLVVAFYKLFTGNWSGALDDLKSSALSILDIFGRLGDVVVNLFKTWGAVGHWMGGAGDWRATQGLLGNASLNAGSIGQPGVGSNPLGSSSNVNSATTNQHVNQQTTVNVMGSADAGATATAVTSQQQNVNRDLVRNLKGATAPAALTP